MKKIFIHILFLLASTSVFAQLNISLIGSLQYEQECSDIWGYVAPDGTEYAIVGVFNGVSIVSLTDPSNPEELFFIPGANSTWRDMKTWGDFAYVTNESAGGLLVVDLTGLPASIDHYEWTPNLTGGLDDAPLKTIHNIFIDEFGIAYLAGSNLFSGGVIYVDVASTPGVPIYVGKGPEIYSHDVYTRNNIMYSSEVYEGVFSIYEVSDKSNTELLGSQATYSNFTHNSWLSDDGNYLFTTDEVGNGTVGAYDVADPTDIKELDQFYPYETVGEGVIPHNVHVWNDWIITSYYTDGCIIIDGSKPDNLVEVGNLDTYLPSNTGFDGAWGAYPFLPSGLILINDINTGLYVLSPNYVRACWLEGVVSNAETGAGINNASVKIVDTNVVESSAFEGQYKTGFATSGAYAVEVSAIGYESKMINVVLENNELTIANVELEQLSAFTFNGSLIDKATGVVIPDATILFESDTYKYQVTTDAFGSFSIPEMYEENYTASVAKWGYTTAQVSLTPTATNNVLIIETEKGYEDIFSTNLGWQVESDAISGAWEIGTPIGGVSPSGQQIAPTQDVPQDTGNSCFLTANNTDFLQSVVLGGSTTVTSPVFDVTDYEAPKLSFYYWYLNANPETEIPSSTRTMEMTLSNGTDTYTENYSFDVDINELSWQYIEIDLPTVIEVTNEMTIAFEVGVPNNFSLIAEGAIDYFSVWDSAAIDVPANTTLIEEFDIELMPNPTNSVFTINYQLANKTAKPILKIYNAIGQLIDVQKLHNFEGSVEFGQNLTQGVYYVQFTNGIKNSKMLKAIKQ